MKANQKAMRRAQAMVEFAIVGPIFFLCLFFATGIMLYEFERSLVVTGVTTGARDAVSSSASAGALPNVPASLSFASAQAAKLMGNSLLANSPGGTKVVDLNSSLVGCFNYGVPLTYCTGAAPCLVRGASPIQNIAPQGTIFVYATGGCGNGEIQVVASGSPRNLVGFLGIKIPLTIQATAVGVEYQR